MNTTLVIAAHVLVLALELPFVVRRRLRREWWAAVAITSVSAVVGVLLALGVPIPSPTHLIRALLKPVAQMMGTP